MQFSSAIRQRIINLARIRKISLRALSRESQVSYATLMGFMVGNARTITLSTLADLCYGLNIDLVDFFNDTLFDDVFDETEKKAEK